MIKTNKFLTMMTMAIGSLILFTYCSDDDDGGGPGGFSVESITAAGTDFETGDPIEDLDLNAATAAEDVPLDAVIAITFSRDVDASTATSSTIILTGDTAVATSVSATGPVVTVTPDGELQRGTTYTLDISSDVAAEGGGNLGSARSITFTTAGRGEVEAPQQEAQQIYVPLDGNAEDQLGNYSIANEAAVTYGEDRFGQAESAAYFDGDATIIEFENGVELISPAFSLAVWLKVDTVEHFNATGDLAGMFAIGMGNFNGWQLELGADRYDQMKVGQKFTSDDPDNPTTAEDFTIWNLDGTLEEFEVNRGADFEANIPGGLQGLMVDKWAHLVYVYDQEENKRYFYINGDLVRSTDFDNSTIPKIQQITGMVFAPSETQDEPDDVEYISRRLALGFVHGSDSKMWADTDFGSYQKETSNHYKGGMDDFRVWNSALTAEQVKALYDAEAP